MSLPYTLLSTKFNLFEVENKKIMPTLILFNSWIDLCYLFSTNLFRKETFTPKFCCENLQFSTEANL